jgi:hypothetical protein
MSFPLRVMYQPPELGLPVHPQLGAPQLQRQRDQTRLRAVVQVTLDPPQLGRLGVNGLSARV